jgi:hypothetical protein
VTEAAGGAPLEVLHRTHERFAAFPDTTRSLQRAKFTSSECWELLHQLASVTRFHDAGYGDPCL